MYWHWQEVTFRKLHFVCISSWPLGVLSKFQSHCLYLLTLWNLQSKANQYQMKQFSFLRFPLPKTFLEVLNKPKICSPFTLSEFWLGKASWCWGKSLDLKEREKWLIHGICVWGEGSWVWVGLCRNWRALQCLSAYICDLLISIQACCRTVTTQKHFISLYHLWPQIFPDQNVRLINTQVFLVISKTNLHPKHTDKYSL